jgi:hypothetical protein
VIAVDGLFINVEPEPEPAAPQTTLVEGA